SHSWRCGLNSVAPSGAGDGRGFHLRQGYGGQAPRGAQAAQEGIGRSVKVSEGSFFMVKENKVLLRGRQEFIYGQEPGELGQMNEKCDRIWRFRRKVGVEARGEGMGWYSAGLGNRYRQFCLPRVVFRRYCVVPEFAVWLQTVARVAQLDRVTASEAAGCGFNSRHAHHFFIAALQCFAGEDAGARKQITG
ncbi:MAG: hypothetical protein JWR19_3589, partial [Pedosphaera sp.]|nr:hypothetical protein [Pedosphaera sp.]